MPCKSDKVVSTHEKCVAEATRIKIPYSNYALAACRTFSWKVQIAAGKMSGCTETILKNKQYGFIRIDRQTNYLLPPSVKDWLPENRLARFIVEVVDKTDLSELTRVYGGRASAAHHPAVLLAFLIYGYATGMPSSDKIERATYDSVAFRYMAINTHPDHDALATFRRCFRAQLEQLLVQVLMLAREMRMLKLGKISVDGTKIKANASKHCTPLKPRPRAACRSSAARLATTQS